MSRSKKAAIYIANVPGFGRLDKKSKISFLSATALVRQSLEINSSIESKLKEQRRLLSAASAIRAPSSTAAGGRKRDAIAEFSHREFGPVITSFEAIEEYPLGTPSWLALRTELEWSRKALYGQLRRWFCVLRSGCIVIKSNQRLGKQIGLSRKAVGEGLEELGLLRLIHVEGPTKGSRCVYLHWHPWMKNPEAVPTWAKLGQVEQLSWPDLARSLGPSSPMSWPNSGHKETSNNDQNKERLLAADGERELLDQLEEILGKTEMKKNGGMWRKRIRGGKVYVKALRNSIEDWKVRIPDQKREIRNPGAWLTDRFQRAIVEIEKAQIPQLRD